MGWKCSARALFGARAPGRQADLLCRHRLAFQKPLHTVAVVVFEKLELLFGLHPLRQHLDAETATERDHRQDDRFILGVATDVAGKALVDLEPIQR